MILTRVTPVVSFVVLVLSPDEVGPCHVALMEAGLLSEAIVVTTERDAEAYFLPSAEQAVVVITDKGTDYGSFFAWCEKMKQKYPKLRLGWFDTDPWPRRPITVAIARGEGDRAYDGIIEEACDFLGLSVFQR